MSENSKSFGSLHASGKVSLQEPTTPRSPSNSRLGVPLVSPVPKHYLSPAFDEFSLRRTPSRGGTASPAPAKGVRKRLHQYRNFDHAVSLLKKSVNIVVLTGAGISTSVGIPDFRSDKGLYQQLSKDLGITEAEEFFSKDYFIQNTDQFFQYVKRVIPEAVIDSNGQFRSVNLAGTVGDGKAAVPEFSQTHAFLALLQSHGKLLTNYTQNIDGLEIAAGVSRDRFIQCHGSWDTASCMTCGKSSAAKKYLPVVFAGNIPFCKCKLKAEQQSRNKTMKRNGKKRRWSDIDSDHSSDDGTQPPRGLLKPDITFFNERLSGAYGDRLDEDKRKIDLLIIIGTSLKVGPVQDMLYQISPRVPQIFISKERFSGALCNLPGVQVDIELLGECDTIIEELCRRAGWTERLKSLCWERGQMNIKSIDGKDVKVQPELQKAGTTIYEDVIKLPKIDQRPQKRVRSSSNDSAHSNVDNDHASEGFPETISNASFMTSSQDGEGPEPIATKAGSVKSGSFHAPDARLGGTIDNHAMSLSNISKLDFADGKQVTSRNSVTDSHVKIELVEGTAHQWRITRR